MANRVDLPAISAALAPAVENEGMELYDLEFLQEHGRAILRVYIDKPEGITLEDCERINYALAPALNEVDRQIPSDYILEVSSPGIERKLVKDTHYLANMGKLAEIRLNAPQYEGRKKFRGILSKLTADELIVDDLCFARGNIKSCRLVYTT
ncbi:MAG: ribosome maturation factor RimP [Turicibacter sp.]|nr:ribosome maturation factor RimP [Turicibacter sp.]